MEPTRDVGASCLSDFGEDGEDSHFGFVAVMTPEHSSFNVHGIPTSREMGPGH